MQYILFWSKNTPDVTIRYLLRTNTSYKHLAKKFERAVLSCVGRDRSEMAVSLRRFFAHLRFLASENGLYELASTFCHVAPDHYYMIARSSITMVIVKRKRYCSTGHALMFYASEILD